MASRIGDLWAEILEEEEYQGSIGVSEPEIVITYRRKKADVVPQNGAARRESNTSSSENGSRKSLAPVKRVSWNRSLSTRCKRRC